MVNYPESPVVLIDNLSCDWLDDSSPPKSHLSDFVSEYSLYQLITVTTYSTGSSLDVIIINKKFSLKSGTIFCHFSPHHFTRVMLDLPRPRLRWHTIECRSFRNFILHAFDSDLLVTDWNSVFLATNVTGVWQQFLNRFCPIVNNHVPVRSVTLRNPLAPPISDGTSSLLADRSRALRQFGHGPDR